MPLARPATRLAALAAAVLLPRLASASPMPTSDVPLPPPPPGTRPIPAQPSPALAKRPAPRPVRFYLGTGIDFGSEQLLEVQFTDGSTDPLDANDGFLITAGASFLPLRGGLLDTLATVGFKAWSVGASNGSVRYQAFPIEVVERARVHPNVRLGAGLNVLLAPSIDGKDLFSDIHADLKNSLGVVLQGEGVFSTGPSEWSAGLRFVWQKLQNENGGATVDANVVGLFLSWQP